jgi:cytochrome c oxidase subunit 4
MKFKEYVLVYIALIALMGLTLGLSYINFKGFNTPISLTIAAAKAVLVVLYFMHAKRSSGLHRILAMVGVFWLGMLTVLVLADYRSRDWLMLPGGWPQWELFHKK